jgi:hypothetical protein
MPPGDKTPGTDTTNSVRNEPEPRWQAAIAVLAVGGLYLALPPYLTVGPRWALPGLVGALLLPTIVTHRAGHHTMDNVLGVMVLSVITISLTLSVALLVSALPAHKESPTQLLSSAASLWCTNVLVFALWYWRLDAGGPHRRASRAAHAKGAFLFPQMTMLPEARIAAGQEHWSPAFIDYLFLAFNTSTAFSPTDTPVLTRWGKALMMIQSIISLMVIALLGARAVNIL